MEAQQAEQQQPLRELIAAGAYDVLTARLPDEHVQDIARALADFEPNMVLEVLAMLPVDERPEVFAYLSTGQQYQILNAADDDIGIPFLRALPADDRTALLESLKPEQLKEILRLLAPAEVRRAMEQLGYPEQSAGRLMNTDFVTVRPNWSLARALDHVRRQGHQGDGVNTLYVTDHRGRLQGTISLKRLVLESPDKDVMSLISGPAVTIDAGEDRSEAARTIQHYDITALPVVDVNGVLLGAVTVDDVMDVVQEEATEDFHKIGAVGALGLSLRDARPSLLYRKRVGWLVLLVFVNILSGAGIALYEATIEQVIALVFFLPLIIASGGNAGSQSATLMVRALATGDVATRDWLRLWGRELGVAIALGVTMGAAIYGVGLWRGGPEVAIVVSLSMVLVVACGSMIGMVLPMMLNRFEFDPATASAPLITSIADICGILIYFSIATAILTLPPP
ncbi:MAG: magnesium transporter [Gammaproteobacteria bacterium]|nr:magnesium transporter [Gammaproteobacteria bacterium]